MIHRDLAPKVRLFLVVALHYFALLPVAMAAPANPLVSIVILGDSVTAGYGLSPEEAYPAVLETLLKDEGYAVRVINAGVSGDTSASALERMDWVLKSKPDLFLIALGANDMIRGLRVAELKKNLNALIDKAPKPPAGRTLLMGMKAFPNLGRAYRTQFDQVYPVIAKARGIALFPFLLDGVAGLPNLNLPDGIHPNPQGHQQIARNLKKFLVPYLKQTEKSK